MEINNKLVQVDSSGQGHAWRAANEDNCPTDIQDEIAAEMIDGKVSECRNYVAKNGSHYRW